MSSVAAEFDAKKFDQARKRLMMVALARKFRSFTVPLCMGLVHDVPVHERPLDELYVWAPACMCWAIRPSCGPIFTGDLIGRWGGEGG